MHLRAEIRGILTGLAVVAVLLLIGGTLWPVIPGQPLLQSLRFHIAAATLVLALVMVLTGARWRGAGVLLLTVLSAGQGGWLIYQQQQTRAPLLGREAVAELDLVSFNMLIDNVEGAPRVAEMLRDRNADVAFILEAAPLFDQLPVLEDLYPYRGGCVIEDACTVLVLSKTPLENVRIGSLSEFSPERLITALTDIDGQSVNLVAVHLTKPYFDFHAEIETWRLRDVLENLEGPVVMAGDFNAAPWSYNFVRLLEDQALLPAPGHPGTWPVRLGPLGVPIDNVYTRGPALITAIEALPDAMGSNHRGLVSHIVITE